MSNDTLSPTDTYTCEGNTYHIGDTVRLRNLEWVDTVAGYANGQELPITRVTNLTTGNTSCGIWVTKKTESHNAFMKWEQIEHLGPASDPLNKLKRRRK